MPEWYPLIRAARYLGVAPWELQAQPIAWQDMALMAENAEAPAPPQAKPGDEWALK
jgi:hypothetical protein